MTHLDPASVLVAPSASDPPTICFCIPTFNRAENLYALVSGILSLRDPRIQVAVLDNASTDNTIDLLSKIKDSSLKLCSNPVNRGVLFNCLKVLTLSSARYSILLLDKDSLILSRVINFIEFLDRHRPVCGYCEHGSALSREPLIYDAGFNAIKNVAYSTNHPTGYFFLSSWLSTELVDKWCNFDVAGHFPFEFIQAEFCCKGPAAVYRDPLFLPETLILGKSKRSFGTNGAIEEPFFSPSERLRLAISFSAHICTLPIAIEAKKKLISHRFIKGLAQATVGYRQILMNKSCCEHYNITPRRVTYREVIGIFARYSIQFNRKLHKEVPSKDIPSLLFIVIYFLRVKCFGADSTVRA